MDILPRSLVVFVQLESQNQNLNLTEEIITLFKTQQQQTRMKRRSPRDEDQCKKQVWIAAKLKEVQWCKEMKKGNSSCSLLSFTCFCFIILMKSQYYVY